MNTKSLTVILHVPNDLCAVLFLWSFELAGLFKLQHHPRLPFTHSPCFVPVLFLDPGNSLLVASYPPGQPSSSPACSWPCWDSLLFPPPQSAGRSSRRSCPPAASSPVGLKKPKKSRLKTCNCCINAKRSQYFIARGSVHGYYWNTESLQTNPHN